MKSKDLIALIKERDPTGEAEVVVPAQVDGYRTIDEIWKMPGIVKANKPGFGVSGNIVAGEYIAEQVYRKNHPRGKKQAIPAILLVD